MAQSAEEAIERKPDFAAASDAADGDREDCISAPRFDLSFVPVHVTSPDPRRGYRLPRPQLAGGPVLFVDVLDGFGNVSDRSSNLVAARSSASNSPVVLPEETRRRPKSTNDSASTVGLPRESMTHVR